MISDWFYGLRLQVEALYIRLLWVKYALRLKRTPGLCPPACSEMHTYRYPCRARFQTKVRYQSKTHYHYSGDSIGIVRKNRR